MLKQILRTIQILFLILILAGGFSCMAYPTFDTNIDDQYTVTQNNAVGAEDRGNVAVTGASEMNITSVPQTFGGNSLNTIKEYIAYAVANSHDVININVNHDYEELAIDIPNTGNHITIQAENGRSVSINLNTFVPAVYNYAQLNLRRAMGAIKFDASDQYSPVCTDDGGSSIYYLKDDGTFGNTTRSNIGTLGKTYMAMDSGSQIDFPGDYEETSLVDNSGTYQLYQGNTLIVSGITSIDTSSPKLIALIPVPAGGVQVVGFLIESPTSGTIRFYGSGGQANITVKDPDGNTFTNMEDWYSDSRSGYVIDLATGSVNGNYISYIYITQGIVTYNNSTAYQDSNYVKTINAKMNTILINENTNQASGYDVYVGGQEIWYYDDANWLREQSIGFEPDSSRFIRAGNMLYFYVSNTGTGRLEIWKKDLLSSNNHTWVRVYQSFQKPYKYVSHYFDLDTEDLRIIFTDVTTDYIYYYIHKGISISQTSFDGKLNGLVINENMVFSDFGKDTSGRDLTTLSAVSCIDEVDAFMTYCSVYANNLHTTFNMWQMNNNILYSQNKNTMYYYGDLDPNYSGNNNNNLLLAGDSGVKFELKPLDTIDFFTISFNNNTIKATNGIQLSGLDGSGETFKNNIIDASNSAIFFNGLSEDMTITNSIINGSVDTGVDVDSTCYQNVLPLFKDPANSDYHLKSKAEGYSKNSLAIGLGDDTKDAGCYDITYTNNGETLKETFELTGYLIDRKLYFEHSQKQSSVDFQGNYIKFMGDRTSIWRLLAQKGNIPIRSVSYLENILNTNDIIRLYPNGSDGIEYIIDETDSDNTVWEATGTLTLDFTALTATAPANHYFRMGNLKGGWLTVTISATPYHFYITGNTETVISLENQNGYTGLSNSTYSCQVLSYLVRMSDTLDYPNNYLADAVNQVAGIPEVDFYVVNSKEA